MTTVDSASEDNDLRVDSDIEAEGDGVVEQNVGAAEKTKRVGPPLAVELDVFDELAAIAQGEGCDLLHVGRHGQALQLILDHEDGITLDHCTSVSRQAGALLEAMDFSKGRYVLEVSSPGLDREFYTLDDYRRYQGRPVKVVHRPGGRKATVRGTLSEFDEKAGLLSVIEADSQKAHQIDLRDVQSTRLEIEI